LAYGEEGAVAVSDAIRIRLGGYSGGARMQKPSSAAHI
jgi:hypothetical protein